MCISPKIRGKNQNTFKGHHFGTMILQIVNTLKGLNMHYLNFKTYYARDLQDIVRYS